MTRLSHRLYNLLTVWAQPLLRRKLARRALAEPGYAQAVPERFGHYSAEGGSGWVWVHAVSLGEARAAGLLMAAMREARPGVRFLLTHGTATGRAEGAKHLQPGDVQVWQPWDTPAAVQAFLAHFRPRIALLMETEVWPNLVQCSRQAGVPVLLVNARLSARSWRAAMRWPGLMRPTYAALTLACPQTQADALRLQQLGARTTAPLGNLKFDATPDAAQQALGRRWRAHTGRPVVVLASSREGEEALWLQAVQAQPQALERVQWLIVPRHPQRVDEVARALAQAGLAVQRRSQWGPEGPTPGPTPGPVWLGDSLGEMALYYSLADVALLGGSYAPLGGQNLIEAAACGTPVLMGPHTFNFLEVAEQAEALGAAQRVGDMAEAVAQALLWGSDGTRQAQRAQQALAFSQAHRGALARLLAQVLAQWPPEAPIRGPAGG